MNNLFDSLIFNVGMRAVDNVLEDEKAQEFFKDMGREVGNGIPGDFAEPKINKVVDLVQSGMMETVQK
jgi:hypothetical protein